MPKHNRLGKKRKKIRERTVIMKCRIPKEHKKEDIMRSQREKTDHLKRKCRQTEYSQRKGEPLGHSKELPAVGTPQMQPDYLLQGRPQEYLPSHMLFNAM